MNGEYDDEEEKVFSKLEETGERAKLDEFLQLKLYECGWRAQIKALCQEIVHKRGLNNITVDELIAGISPKARELVPDHVKRALVQRIRAFLVEQHNLK